MSDLNWCTYCDNAIEGYSDSLYCSDECLRSDCLEHHPLLGYDYRELKNFPRPSSSSTRKVTSAASSAASSAVISSSTTANSDWDDSSFTTISSTISTPSSSPSTSSSTLSLLSPPPSPSNSYQGIDKEEIYNLNYINNKNKTTMTTKHRTTPSIFYI